MPLVELSEKELSLLYVDVSTPAGHQLLAALERDDIHLKTVVGDGRNFLRVRTEHEQREEMRINMERTKEARDLVYKAAGL